jgi:hypothetical protein
MWNQIRGAGWYTRGQNGETEVWAKGNGNQTVSETMSLCMLRMLRRRTAMASALGLVIDAEHGAVVQTASLRWR